jgi:hypothetical protein
MTGTGQQNTQGVKALLALFAQARDAAFFAFVL